MPSQKGTDLTNRLAERLLEFSTALSADEQIALRVVLASQLDPPDRLAQSRQRDHVFSQAEQLVIEQIRQTIALETVSQSNLNLIVKLTRNCNLRCVYCHDWWNGAGSQMTFEVVANVIAKALSSSRRDSIHFMWHGGEPLTLQRDFYEKLLLLQSEFRGRGQRIQNSIQTNATLITPEWAAFLKRHEFNVGVSLDGPQEIHDATRVDVQGKPTFQRVLHGIELLREAGVAFSILMVVEEKTLQLGAVALCEFLWKADLRHVGLIAAKPTNMPDAPKITVAEHYIAPGRFNRFLADFYDYSYIDSTPKVRVRELDAICNQIGRTGISTCTMVGDCLGQYYSIEPNGDVAHCDLYVGDQHYTLGNILATDFIHLSASPAIEKLRARRASDLDLMRECGRFDVCNGWCPHEKYLSSRHNIEHTDYCCGLKELIDHVALQGVQ